MTFAETYLAILLLLISLPVGSFLGVLVDRLPRGEVVLRAPSQCRACGHKLAIWDLVPVIGFLLLRGKCRFCQAPIAGWHLYLELVALGLAVMALSAGGTPAEIWANAVFLWLLLALLAADLLWFRLPDLLTFAVFCSALSVSYLSGTPSFPGGALIGAACGSGSFLVLRLGYQALRQREGLGLGDVKLIAGLGAFSGVWDLPLLLLIASLGALIGALLDQVLQGRTDRLATRRVPFGAALCAAALVLWVLRHATLI